MEQLTLTTEQQLLVDNAVNFILQDYYIDEANPYLTIGGYAGTGKTTIIPRIKKQLQSLSFHHMAFTGKAVMNLASKIPQSSENDQLGSISNSAKRCRTSSKSDPLDCTSCRFASLFAIRYWPAKAPGRPPPCPGNGISLDLP